MIPALMAGAGSVAKGATQIKAMMQISADTKGARSLTSFISQLVNLRQRMIAVGIVTIFVDRVIQSLNRAWDALNQALGVSEVSKTALEFDRLAEYLGVDVEQFQLLASATSDYDIDARALTDTMQTLNEKLVDLSNGSKEMIRNFDALGLGIDDFAGRDNIQKILMLADAFRAADKNARVGILSKILGGEKAMQLGKAFERGSQGLLDGMKEAVEVGDVFTKQQLTTAEAFETSAGRFKRAMKGLKRQTASIFIPAMTDLAEALRVLIIPITNLVRSNIGVFASHVAGVVRDLLNDVKALGKYIEDNIMPGNEFLLRSLRALALAGAMLGALFFAPMIVGTLALGAAMWSLGVLIEDYINWSNGKNSVIGTLLKDSPAFKEFVFSLVVFFEEAKRLGLEIVALFTDWMGSSSFWSGPKNLTYIFAIVLRLIRELVTQLRIVMQIVYVVHEVIYAIAGIIEFIVRLIMLSVGQGSLSDLINVGKEIWASAKSVGYHWGVASMIGAERSQGRFFATTTPSASTQYMLGPSMTSAAGFAQSPNPRNPSNVTVNVYSNNPVTSIPGAINTGISTLPGQGGGK